MYILTCFTIDVYIFACLSLRVQRIYPFLKGIAQLLSPKHSVNSARVGQRDYKSQHATGLIIASVRTSRCSLGEQA